MGKRKHGLTEPVSGEVRCPYCRGIMTARDYGGVYWYTCGDCGATSPPMEDLAAATRKAQSVSDDAFGE